MKNILFIACMLTFAMSSCTQDELFSSDGDKEQTADSRFTLIGLTTVQTRTSIGDKTGDIYPVLWGDGDALGLFSRTQGADIENVEALLSGESIGQNSGVFTAESVSPAKEGETTILVYYPYKANTTLADNGNKITATLATDQEQSKPGDSNHIGRYGFGYAKTTVNSASQSAKFTLKHAMAYVKFRISSQELAAYKLKSVSLYDKDTKTPLSGTFIADLDTDELTFGSEKKPYATVSLSAPELLATTQEVYLTTYPVNLTDKQVYIVVTLENENQATLNIPILKEGKMLKANAVNVIAINNLKLSDNSCEWYEPVETRLLAGGWAYGESNCVMTTTSTVGVNNSISVKARGNFMEVEEPKYAGTIFNSDLNNDHKMVGVNGSTVGVSPVGSNYEVTINAYKVTGGYDGGCGQVAIYGEDQSTPLWSFIVWMTPTPAEHAYGNTGYIVQDRNLGTYTIEDNWKTNGVYFQWGRPTPFGWGAKGYYSMPTEATDVRFSVENPRYLLYTATVDNTKSDWYLGAWTGARTDRKDDFWGNPNESNTYNNPSDGHKSIYDPCPKGYRVVSPGVLAEVEKSGVYEKLNSIAVIKYRYDGSNDAYWPLAGARWGSNPSDRTANNSTTSACYWSNSSATNYGNDKDQGATALFYKAADNTWTYSAGRSHAFSVRCMKDTENR